MADTSDTYPEICYLEPGQVRLVRGVIDSHSEFAAIQMTVYTDNETHAPYQTGHIPDGKVLVIFTMPNDNDCVPEFYGAWVAALNKEQKCTVHREKEG